MRWILASASPRRRELLRQIELPFEVSPSEADENIERETPELLVEELSRRKCAEVGNRIGGECLVLAVKGPLDSLKATLGSRCFAPRSGWAPAQGLHTTKNNPASGDKACWAAEPSTHPMRAQRGKERRTHSSQAPTCSAQPPAADLRD